MQAHSLQNPSETHRRHDHNQMDLANGIDPKKIHFKLCIPTRWMRMQRRTVYSGYAASSWDYFLLSCITWLVPGLAGMITLHGYPISIMVGANVWLRRSPGTPCPHSQPWAAIVLYTESGPIARPNVSQLSGVGVVGRCLEY